MVVMYGPLQEAFKSLESSLSEENIEHVILKDSIELRGITLYKTEDPKAPKVMVIVDSAAVETAITVVERMFKTIIAPDVLDTDFHIVFRKGVDWLAQHHTMTGRLFNTEVRMRKDGALEFKSLKFKLKQDFSITPSFDGFQSASGPVRLVIQWINENRPLIEVQELLRVLFESEVLGIG